MFRGTPVLGQLFLIYYGAGQLRAELQFLGLWNLFRDPFCCAIFTFALNSAAYQSEIILGAIRGMPSAQLDAAMALGLPRLVTLRTIIIPQASLLAMRPLGNELILTVKASAIASVVTVLDLMGETRIIYSRTFDLSIFIWVALFYLIIVELLRRMINTTEQRLTRHLHLSSAAPKEQHARYSSPARTSSRNIR